MNTWSNSKWLTDESLGIKKKKTSLGQKVLGRNIQIDIWEGMQYEDICIAHECPPTKEKALSNLVSRMTHPADVSHLLHL